MRTVLATIFLLSFFAACSAVLALFTLEAQPSDYALAAILSGLSAAVFVGSKWWMIRFGRIGYLKPRLFKKRLTPQQHKALLAQSAAALASEALSAKMQAQNNQTPRLGFDLRLEMSKLKELGINRPDRSSDELLSEKLLIRFIDQKNADRSAPPKKLLRDVRDKREFLRLRAKVDDWYVARSHRAEAFEAWEAEIGHQDQSHLLKEGWIAFLKTLPGPDIHLWHGIATDFHNMSDDRLDAAFWIVEQQACDRTTASEFIMGFLQAYLDLGASDPKGENRTRAPDPQLRRFLPVVRRYNDGFYKAQSLPANLHAVVLLTDAEADRILTKYEHATGLRQLERPRGIVKVGDQPTHASDRGYKSPYDFYDEAGLHLKYPGPDWRQAG
ncbi:MAG: hypothetical protein AAGD04_05935 [Pseudomonadota bacterium]